jgi:ATP/maltotriose-dependent transcriptional regulator MalT
MLESMADAARMDSEDLVRRVAAEMDNLRAAQAWARSSRDVDLTMAIVAWPSILSVFFSDVLAWAAEATTMPGAKDHPSFPVVMAMVANGAGRTGDLVRARELSLRALDLIDHPDDPRRLLPLIELTWVAAQRGHLEEARRLNDEWLRVARANDELPTLVWGHATRGLIESFAGDHAKGIEWAEAAYAVARTGSTALQGMALYALGDTLTQTGQDAERALDCLEQSIALCRANRMHFMAGVSLISLASMRARHGDPLEALPMFRDIVDHWRRGGEWGRQWNTIRNLAELLARIGDDDTAATLLAASEASATATPIFGTQGDRLAKLRRELSERMGGEAFAVAIQRGRAMSDEEAVAYAKTEIDRALDHLRVHEDRSEPTRS